MADSEGTSETNPEPTELRFAGGYPAQSNQSKDGMGPLTITAENMTDTEIDCIIEDAKKANKELHIKDTNGKVTQTLNEREKDIENNSETSELELLSNLSSSTEIEQDPKENNIRRSKRLTNRYHLITGNTVNNRPGKQPGIRRKPDLFNEHSHNRTVQETKTDRRTNDDLTRTTANTKAEPWNTPIKKKSLPLSVISRPIAKGE